MATESSGWRWGMLFLGGSLAVGLIVATHLLTRSLMKTRLVDQSISVKGYAERKIVADRASWDGSFGAGDAALVAAYGKLQAHVTLVQQYLDRQGVPKQAVNLAPVHITSIFKKDEKGNNTNQLETYWLEQPFEVNSDNVRLIEKTAKEAAELIKSGVELKSNRPQYVFTKLNDLKADMIAEATRNARQRAEQLAANSGSTVGSLRSARQGVFQITPPYSTEVSDSGENDTTTIDKLVKAVVTVEFAIKD